MTINPDNKFYPFGIHKFDQIVNALKAKGVRKTVHTGDLILEEGANANFFFYIDSGCFRAYRFIGSKEVTVGFSFKGDLDTCPYSFINDTPSLDNIEALTPGSIIIIHKPQLLEMEKEHPEVKQFVHFMLTTYIETLINRSLEQRTLTSGEMYLKLQERQPLELSKVPLKHLASYLGITPERLSRIRKNGKN